MEPKTLFDKIWDNHIVYSIVGGPDVLYIDRHYIHEVTSPQAFNGLEMRGIKVFRPSLTLATADHNTPTKDQHLPIKDELSRNQVEKLTENCRIHGIELYGLNHKYNGIVHIIGPELGLTRPGMTIVCGDSHTATHGAFGSVAFGIGTSEVEMVLATQCILQTKPAKMRITLDGELQKGVTSKDIIMFIISKLSSGGATGYFVEYSGRAIEKMSMEARMTICNMSIEMGARGGLIAPDQVTYDYLKQTKYFKENPAAGKKLEQLRELRSDPGAAFDKEIRISADKVKPMITFGTNPGMAVAADESIPSLKDQSDEESVSFLKSLNYMGFKPGEKMAGKNVDYVFLGSCTNGRIEDFRAFASLVKGRKKLQISRQLLCPDPSLLSNKLSKRDY